ncbi:MAG: carbohydrate kinase family protein [bacterium]
MKLLLIGSSVIDYIHVNNKVTVKPGGVFYSAYGLSTIQNEIDDLYLLTNCNSNDFYMYKDVYKFFNLSLSNYVDILPAIHLFLHKDKERTECYQNITEELMLNHLIDFEIFDAIYINMITGFDISIEVLEYIRQNFSKTIYIDIHSLARGLEKNNMRNFRKIPNIDRWLKCIDIIQVNETEFKMLSLEKEKKKILEQIFNFEVNAVIITKAEKGIEGYLKVHNTIRLFDIPALKIKQLNSVGCGDIFGSMFFYSYISTSDFEKSLIFANKSAGIFSSCKDIYEFKIGEQL